MHTIHVHTDGGSRGNPGPSGLGVYIHDGKGGVIKEISKFLGECTNNVAEYEAVLTALQALRRLYKDKTREMKFEVRMDSELIQRQLTGMYRVKDTNLKIIFEKVQKLRAEHFPHISFIHVRREKNKEADRLANEAMDRGRNSGH